MPVLIASLLQAFGLTGTPQEPNALGWICTLVTLGVGLWFLIDLGILKGTPGPNRFGGDPLAAVRLAFTATHRDQPQCGRLAHA